MSLRAIKTDNNCLFNLMARNRLCMNTDKLKQTRSGLFKQLAQALLDNFSQHFLLWATSMVSSVTDKQIIALKKSLSFKYGGYASDKTYSKCSMKLHWRFTILITVVFQMVPWQNGNWRKYKPLRSLLVVVELMMLTVNTTTPLIWTTHVVLVSL